jgi:DNA polymerase III epsilon subunit-like protein
MSDLNHFVLDLETLGVSPGCGILSIAIHPMDNSAHRFYGFCYHASNAEVGLRTEAGTAQWWAAPERAALWEEFCDPESDSVTTLIHRLSRWLAATKEIVPNMRIWGNGALFDWGILEAAATQLGIPLGFDSRHVMCYRTLKNLLPAVQMPKPFLGTPHYAPHDAMNEARHLAELLSALEP